MEPTHDKALPDEPALPLHAVTGDVRERTRRLFHPGGYEITGLVLTQRTSSWKAIVDVTGTRYMSLADLEGLMKWKKPTGSGAPPDGVDESHACTPPADEGAAPIMATTTSTSKRPLAAAPSHPVTSDVEEALGILAKKLGCTYNDAIAHNTGWFVPGMATAYMSALDAIEALFASLRNGGTTYEPATGSKEVHVHRAKALPASGEVVQLVLC